jgi:hypothetical protein
MHPTWYVKTLLLGASVASRTGNLETSCISSTTVQEKAPVPMSSTLVSLSLIPTLRVVSPASTLSGHATLTTIGAEHLANYSGDDSNEDDYNHGTHVAGTIGSRMFELESKAQQDTYVTTRNIRCSKEDPYLLRQGDRLVRPWHYKFHYRRH